MAELESALSEALSGSGRLVMMSGAPGIGKTRTAQELGARAGQRGAKVLWGSCFEEEGSPPFWPWVQAIRSYVVDKQAEELRSEMGSGAEYISEIVSSVRDLLPDLGKPADLEPGQARFRLFDSITSFLKNAAQNQPIMLVLENLHWADRSSMMLLQFVARELSGSRLLLVGTHRDTEPSQGQPLSESLDALDRQQLLTRVILGGHTRNDVVRLIEMTAGLSPPWELVQAVHVQTEGNPLFVTEVARMLAQEGQLTANSSTKRDAWTAHIPENVRDVIGRRLDRLSEECKELLRVAAVSGRDYLTIAVSAMQQGAYDYVNKPVRSLTELTLRTEQALSHRALVLENKRYQENLEQMVQERTAELEQRMRELNGWNGILRTELNQNIGKEEDHSRLQKSLSGYGSQLLEFVQQLTSANSGPSEAPDPRLHAAITDCSGRLGELANRMIEADSSD